MTPTALIETSLLMGLFVLAGGAYGTLYAFGRLRSRPNLVRMARVCCALAFGCAVAITVLTPLDDSWKLLILASAAVYIVIPPVTWRHLEHQHAQEELNR
ncbi:MAG: hypothetical protein EPN62_13210 [Candidimonas sp.]|nr:MAG: hypothetical protein EPN77_11385 [Candidimonas sp.]TAM21918.1 MAG: hypothetical protein EPN62_13210 [Candidimonas sp.]